MTEHNRDRRLCLANVITGCTTGVQQVDVQHVQWQQTNLQDCVASAAMLIHVSMAHSSAQVPLTHLQVIKSVPCKIVPAKLSLADGVAMLWSAA